MSRLTIKDAKIEDQGNYRCVGAISEMEPVSSKYASLSVTRKLEYNKYLCLCLL